MGSWYSSPAASGRVFGGDANFFWVGSYELENGKLLVELDVKNFSGFKQSVFGPLDQFKLKIEATPPAGIKVGQSMEARGVLVSNQGQPMPSQPIVIVLTYQAPLT